MAFQDPTIQKLPGGRVPSPHRKLVLLTKLSSPSPNSLQCACARPKLMGRLCQWFKPFSFLCTSGFFKYYQNSANPKDLCHLRHLKTHECVFLQIAQETMQLAINNLNKKSNTVPIKVIQRKLVNFLPHCMYYLEIALLSLNQNRDIYSRILSKKYYLVP